MTEQQQIKLQQYFNEERARLQAGQLGNKPFYTEENKTFWEKLATRTDTESKDEMLAEGVVLLFIVILVLLLLCSITMALNSP
jgi:hypothetical protein